MHLTRQAREKVASNPSHLICRWQMEHMGILEAEAWFITPLPRRGADLCPGVWGTPRVGAPGPNFPTIVGGGAGLGIPLEMGAGAGANVIGAGTSPVGAGGSDGTGLGGATT